MEEKKKFDWARLGDYVIAAIVVALWAYGYISLSNDRLTGGMLLCLAVISFVAACYAEARTLDPYLERIEKLENEKLELQAKMETMKSEAKKKSAKSKKND